MKIRTEIPQDRAAIYQLTQAAFKTAEHNSGTEGAIINALRMSGNLTLSLVAEQEDSLIGHIAFSPVLIDGQDLGWYGLGPVSVAPDHQGQGIGAALIHEGLAILKANGAKGCVLVGYPDYYTRFGFHSNSDITFEGVPEEYFMHIAFGNTPPKGAASFHPAFDQS